MSHQITTQKTTIRPLLPRRINFTKLIYFECPRNATMYATSMGLFFLGPLFDIFTFDVWFIPTFVQSLSKFLKKMIYCVGLTFVICDETQVIMIITAWIAGLFEFRLFTKLLRLQSNLVFELVEPILDCMYLYYMFIFIDERHYWFDLLLTLTFFKKFVPMPTIYEIFNPLAWISFGITCYVFDTITNYLFDNTSHLQDVTFFTYVPYRWFMTIYVIGEVTGFKPDEPCHDEIWFWILRNSIGSFSMYITKKLITIFIFLPIIVQIFII
jgi:hypothetical protein